ncbi:MAG TPA: FAD:protein FMN transferase [Streptosporangiaceae bacterium]|nr:FAD:protein FMN transferase [Streptosporangiaceae bacterium]
MAAVLEDRLEPALIPRLAPSPFWRMTSVGSRSVAVAERDAIGTTARLAIWPPGRLRPALGAIDAEIRRLDLAASRFRADSEISRVQAAADGTAVPISESLAEVIGVALAAARWTGGLVDPTVGAALEALGYDRDFVLVSDGGRLSEPVAVPGWRSVGLDGPKLSLPAGIRLDFGATAKGLGADWAACAAAVLARGDDPPKPSVVAAGRGGVLVSLGGDIRVAGQEPLGGWPVLIADEHRQSGRARRPGPSTQVVRLPGGALATSSITCRQWRRDGTLLHHIVDPRTGRPATGPWRTVSVAAATCAEANAAATAAIVIGDSAADWLASRKLPARLVTHDGSVLTVAGWPGADGGSIAVPPPQMPLVTRALRHDLAGEGSSR